MVDWTFRGEFTKTMTLHQTYERCADDCGKGDEDDSEAVTGQ